jgi:hypothetical protein
MRNTLWIALYDDFMALNDTGMSTIKSRTHWILKRTTVLYSLKARSYKDQGGDIKNETHLGWMVFRVLLDKECHCSELSMCKIDI